MAIRTLTFRYVHDALTALSVAESDARIEATLHGRVLKVRRSGGVVFFDFVDPTSAVQLLASRDDFAPDDWDVVKRLKAGTVVTARGRLEKLDDRPPRVRVVEISAKQVDVDGTVRDLDNVGARLFLARLRSRAEAAFLLRDYLQIEPRYISTHWSQLGIEPLRVHYQGFGVPTYLTPSPFPQLQDALLETGTDRVFAIGRCFTTTYRDQTSSAESLILCGAVSNATSNAIIEDLTFGLEETLGDRETMPEGYQVLLQDGWTRRNTEWPPSIDSTVVSAPTLQIMRPTNVASHAVHRALARYSPSFVVRACWPGGHVLGEASLLTTGQGERSGTGCVVLHIERMVPLLKDVQVRQLRDLQRNTR